MNPAPAREQGQQTWSLWIAAAIIAVGGLLPLGLGGTSSRIAGVLIPFTVAAVLLAACAWFHAQSRTFLALVYFFAGLVIIYGLLSMVSLPVRLAVLGSCPAAPDPCTSGLPRAMTDGENLGMGSAAAFGIVGLLLGFYGLATLYRRTAARPLEPAARKIPPVAPRQPSATATEVKATEPFAEPEPELPAPQELPELPAHGSSAPNA